MRGLRPTLLCLGTIVVACGPAGAPQATYPATDIPPRAVVPSPEQLAYQQMELIGFVHFSVNTFTDREWGYGDESPETFAPSAIDAEQWAATAAEIGMKELILTAKHHDGFALWPSRYTEHSVKNSRWRGGGGDVVGELVEAARRHDVKVGLYLSPWDRNHAGYGTPAYIDYYRNQLTELLTGYGDITEMWFDGANGGDGFYGGANEERRIDRASYYDWPNTWALVKSLQPGTLIFSDAGPDIRWTGNENGFAGVTNWSTIDAEGIVVGAADSAYLNRGDPGGAQWVVPLCNTSIRPGWFYHEAEDDRLKSPQELIDVYYRSVGRNCVLLLNVPPDRRGRWHDNDVAVLREFRRILDETFATDLAAGKPVAIVDEAAEAGRRGAAGETAGTTGETAGAAGETAGAVGETAGIAGRWRGEHPKFAPANITDADPESYWATEDEVTTATLEIDLGAPTRFDRILLQEPIRFGQRVAEFAVRARIGGEWREIARATTIGYKRLLRVDPVIADRVRVVIERVVDGPVALSAFGLFQASPAE
jgi:alpha-L-fucosidase